MHHSVGPSLSCGCTCIGVWSNIQEDISVHPSYSVTIYILCNTILYLQYCNFHKF
jgi:hypothetical protein